jgi:hypothetical protein
MIMSMLSFLYLPFFALETYAQRSGSRRLTARDVTSLNGTTIFGVIISVGFAGLVFICAYSMQAYRRARQPYIMTVNNSPWFSTEDEPLELPELWDINVRERSELALKTWQNTLVSFKRLC